MIHCKLIQDTLQQIALLEKAKGLKNKLPKTLRPTDETMGGGDMNKIDFFPSPMHT